MNLKDQGGVTLLETAIVIPLLLMLAIGLAEIGFLVIDQMAVANAAREGARVGAAAGPYDDGTSDADDLILRSVEQALCHLEGGRAERVLIYPADSQGGLANPGLVNEYTLPMGYSPQLHHGRCDGVHVRQRLSMGCNKPGQHPSRSRRHWG